MRTHKHAALKQFLAASVATLTLSTVLATPAAAQQTTSGIEGTVTDADGAPLAGAEGDGHRHAHGLDAHGAGQRGRQFPPDQPDHRRSLHDHRQRGGLRGPDAQRHLHQPAGQHQPVVPADERRGRDRHHRQPRQRHPVGDRAGPVVRRRDAGELSDHHARHPRLYPAGPARQPGPVERGRPHQLPGRQRPVEHLHGGRHPAIGQLRTERHAVRVAQLSADPVRRHPGDVGRVRAVRRAVRQLHRLRGQRGDQVGHQPVPRVGLLHLHRRRAAG